VLDNNLRIGCNLGVRCCVKAWTNAPPRMHPVVRLCATTTLLVACTHGATAQYAGIGLKLGPQASKTPNALLQTTWLPGAVAGIYAPWGVGPRMELQPEILISAMGSGYIEPDQDRYTVRSMYIQVPVSFKMYLSNAFNLHGGVQASRLISAERTFAEDRSDFTSRFNRMDYALIGGLGLDLASGFDFTLRYLNGMTPVLANDQVLFPRNQALSMTAGYRMVQVRTKNKSRRRK